MESIMLFVKVTDHLLFLPRKVTICVAPTIPAEVETAFQFVGE